ncbi:MAG: alpha/beta fold hydrolase [Oscillospiraceae bacterium]|nr:alpha/beta fold hydrolase [Oscillospiraceae bacterium]
MAVTEKNGTFLSGDGKTQIYYRQWTDDAAAPRAILQLAHGMAEYIGRYAAFAQYMARNGFVVFGSDHLGHGETAKHAGGEKGFFADKDGWSLLPDDVHTLTMLAKKAYPGLPVVLLGHSMGSFIVRLYAARYSKDIDALVVMGTSGRNPAGGAGIFLINVLSLFKGEHHRSPFINNVAFGAYLKRIPDAKTPFDWLSTEPGNVERYAADDDCGYLFTLSGYRDLMKLLGEVSKKDWPSKIRADLPVLLISGAEDPVGNYGAGVREVYDSLKAAGMKDVTLRLIEGKRHEILNEDNKLDTYAGLLAWCKDKAKIK